MISFFSRLFKKAPSKPARQAHAHANTHAAKGPTSPSAATATPDLPQNYGAELTAIALNDNSSKRKTAARQRIAKLLEQGDVSLTQITADTSSSDDLLTLCSFNEKAAAEILKATPDQNTLAALANEAPTAAVRKAAAEKVTQRSAVEAMLKGAKGKDKHVYKIAKAALAVFKAADEALAQTHASIANLCADAERHGKKPFDHLYTHKFNSLQNEWKPLKADTTAELQTRFDNAMAKCKATIDTEVNKESAKAHAEATAYATVAGINNASQAISQLASELYAATEWTTDAQANAEQQLKTQAEAVRLLIQQAQTTQAQASQAIEPAQRQPGQPESAEAKALRQMQQVQQQKQQMAQQYFYQVSEATHGLLNKIAQGELLTALTQQLTPATANSANVKTAAPSSTVKSTEIKSTEALITEEQTTEAKSTEVESTDVESLATQDWAAQSTAESAAESINKEAPQNAQQLEQACTQVAELLAFSSQFKDFTSPAAQEAQAAIADWQKAKRDTISIRKAAIGNISDLMRRASSAARNGQIRRARGIYRELTEKREQLADIPQGLANKLEDLDAEITKLGDWHEFAVTPKKQALVEAMNALHSSTLAPDDLADKIHSLQDEWKVLCKGGENQDADIWQAFQASADTAFEPCKKHFAEQAQMREANATERLALIDQLTNYHAAYDWNKAIWKDVEQTLRVAKDTWKTLWPVPRQKQKEIQASFDVALDKIYAHMNTAYDAAKAQKEQLIVEAKNAAQNTDAKAAAEHVKQLQANWKLIGRSYRKTDQQLWAEFRTVCDEIFNKRQAVYDEANAERDQLVIQAEAQIDSLTALSQQPGHELQTLGTDIAAIKEAFYALGDVPKAQVSKLHKILQTIDNNIEQYRSTAKEQVWGTLFELNSQLNTLEAAAANGEDTSEAIEAFKTALNAQKLPGNNAAIFAQRLTTLATANSDAVTQLQLLCIRAEIAKGIDSPQSDKALRMEYQVGALQQNFGGNNQNDTPESLTAQWLAIYGCPSTDFNTLQTRFLHSCFPQFAPAAPKA